jgi:CheY-like chemotaxis protein
VDGFEVLMWIRRQPGFGSIPVVVLTSSDAIRDVNRAYSLGANSFLVKSLDFDNFIETAKALRAYWLNANKAAHASRPARSSADITQPK